MQDEEKVYPNGTNQTSRIDGRYVLRQSLGRGSFGQVFLAEDLNFEPPRKVAIKMLHQHFLEEPGIREDIKREAGTLARFHHPNILRVIDFSVTSELAYIVTDLAEGGSLATKLRPDPTKPPIRMPLEEVAWYLEQIADAIDEAHSKGLLHRDIKPLNILLDKRGRPLVADFGLATAVSNSQTSALIDASTSGTPPYMAPEQWRGQVSRTSDIYALTVLTYQMITGQLPYQGIQFELMGQHLNEPIPPLSFRAPDLKYPPALDEVIAGAMAKDPKLRTRPAMEFYRQFRAVLTTPSVVSEKQLTPAHPPKSPKVGVNPPPSSRTPVNPVSDNKAEQIAFNGKKQPKLGKQPGIYIPSVSPPQNTPIKEKQVLSNKPSEKELFITGLTFGTIVIALLTILILASTVGPLRTYPTPTPTTRAIPAVTTARVTTVAATITITPTTLLGHSSSVRSVKFSPDGKILASGSDDKTIKLWEVTSGKELNTLSGHSKLASSVAFSPDGKTLASGSDDQTIKLWEVVSGKELNTFSAHSGRVTSVAFSPDAKTLASGSTDTTIRLWEAASGIGFNTLFGQSSPVVSLAFSPDGKILASGSSDDTIRVWEVAPGKKLNTLFGQSSSIVSVAFSPDGKILASGTGNKTIKLWEVISGKELNTLYGHSNIVSSVAFSPDAKTLASGSTDKTIKLWDISSGKELTTLSGHSSWVSSVEFNSDGKVLASASDDKTIKLWDVSQINKS